VSDVFIVGCGYVGRRVAALERAEGNRVHALARSSESAEHLLATNIEPILGNLDDPPSLENLPIRGDLVYYFAPPPSCGISDPRMESFLAALRPPQVAGRIVLISTSGVYGDCRGAWVDEAWTPNPTAERAKRRLAAEITLQGWSERSGVPVVILRVSGIYGPGRLPEERLRKGLPVLHEEQAPYSNRIHVQDLARVCVAAARHGRSRRIYNVTDDEPSTMTDYFYRVADLLGLARPPAISLEEARRELSPGMISYLEESRRLKNLRMHEELGIGLLYPGLASGLPSCLTGGRDATSRNARP
jgi:nucleoside-diphosphate-sugar epimerase